MIQYSINTKGPLLKGSKEESTSLPTVEDASAVIAIMSIETASLQPEGGQCVNQSRVPFK